MRMIGLILAATAVVILLACVYIFNRLVTCRNRYRNAYAQIDVQLKRRYDLIPNLVEVAKGYMAHERETLESVIAARSQALAASREAARNPGDPDLMRNLGLAEGVLSASLGRLMMLQENYPELKASQNMLHLSEELTSTENRVAFARQSFNDFVTGYNNAREVFPNNLIASLFRFTPAEWLQATGSDREREVQRLSL